MKISTQLKQINFPILLILLLFNLSCKKEEILELRPKTAADFQKIILVNKNIQEFTTIAHLLYIEKANSSNLSSLMTKYDPTVNYNPISTKDVEELKETVKTKADLLNVFKKMNINNSAYIVDLLEKQNNAMFAFMKEYPEFIKLTVEEKKKLLLDMLNTNAKKEAAFAKSSSIGGFNISGNSCQYTYETNLASCEFYYNLALIGVWG